MADSFKSLSDLVTLNDARNTPKDISDILNDSPVLRLLAADTAKETTYYYTKYTTAPTVGFRAANDGRENSKSGDTQVTVTLKIMDATFAVDIALADAYREGTDAYLQKEAMRHWQQAMFNVEKQFFYGTVHGDSAGFAGLGNETDLNGASDAMIVDAGGTTSSTGSSVFAVRTGDNDAGIVVGNSGNLTVGETTISRIAGSSTGTFPAYYTPMSAYFGARRGGTYSVARLANLTADSGKGLTDARIASLLSLFPASKQPTFLAMNRRSLKQLQAARTATNSTGAPAPFPTEAFGIPIVLTDAIISTETLLA